MYKKINKNKITYITAHKWEITVEPELGAQVNLKKFKYYASLSMSSD